MTFREFLNEGTSVTIPFDELKDGFDSVEILDATASKYYRNIAISLDDDGDVEITSGNYRELKDFLKRTGFMDYAENIAY